MLQGSMKKLTVFSVTYALLVILLVGFFLLESFQTVKKYTTSKTSVQVRINQNFMSVKYNSRCLSWMMASYTFHL